MRRAFTPGVALLLCSGCQPTVADVAPARIASEMPSTNGPPTSVGETGLATGLLGSWRLVSFSGEDVRSDQLLITFEPTKFTAAVNCNKVGGFYSLNGYNFIPAQVYATERGCGPAYKHDEALTRTLQFGMVLRLTAFDRLEGQVGERQLDFVRAAK